MIKRYPTKQIYVGNVPIGGDAPISVQSMTFTKTSDVEATVEQIKKLHFAGADIVRVAVPHLEDAQALKEIKKQVDLPIVADIHFHYKLALIAAEVVDCIRINPGNIGDKKRVAEVVKACQARNIPIRIGVNCGSLEKEFEDKYGQTARGMVASAEYNIKYLEDLGFTDIKVSLKASDVQRTVEAYRLLRPMNNYPFHLGVTEAGTQFHSTIKSSIALGSLLLDGIGDTLRVSMTGELEEEIKVGKGILKDLGISKLEGGQLIETLELTEGNTNEQLPQVFFDLNDKMQAINIIKRRQDEKGTSSINEVIFIKTVTTPLATTNPINNSQELEAEKFLVSPNPTIDGIFNLNFILKEKMPAKILIFDISGKQVYFNDLEDFDGTFNEKIDLGKNLAKGTYLIQVQQNGKKRNEKLILQ